jgi:hypothetical protein
MEQLRYLDAAPSIQMQEIPPDIQGFLDGEEEQRDHRSDTTKDRRGVDRHYDNGWYHDDKDNDGEAHDSTWMDTD